MSNVRFNSLQPMNRTLWISLALAISVSPSPAMADDHPKIRAINITAQAGLTVLSALIQGKIHEWKDVIRCVSSGAASGYGFYEGKVLIGKGHAQTGLIVANVSGLLTENAAAGRHPFSQLGYSIGPVRFRISLPHIDKDSDSWVHVDVSAFQSAAFIVAATRGDHIEWRNGLIAFRRGTPFPNGGGPAP